MRGLTTAGCRLVRAMTGPVSIRGAESPGRSRNPSGARLVPRECVWQPRRVIMSVMSIVQAVLLIGPGLVGTAQSPTADRPPLDYFVVVTGSEILDGLYPDSHTHFLTRTLRPLGGRCVGAITVDDRAEDLMAALRFALGKAGLIIVTGGLGPTPNDITRETLARFTGIALREQSDVVADLEKRLNQSRDQFRPTLRRQALVPVAGTYFPNHSGTAVGLLFDTTNAAIVALPGPPRELQPMVEQELLPLLQRRFGLRPAGATLTMRFVGIGQSQISQTLQDHAELPSDLVITSQFDAGRVDFTFSFPGQSVAEKARVDTMATILRRELGEFLYAEDSTSLEDQVIGAFARRGLTLALAEVGSGGHLTDSLAQVPNLDHVLVGSYVAPNERQLCQLLQLGAADAPEAERLRAIAIAARAQSGSDVAVVVGIPTRDRGGLRSVHVLWLDPSPRETQFTNSDSSKESHALLTTRILDWLRRQFRTRTAG